MKEGLPVVALIIYEQVQQHYANHPIANNTVYEIFTIKQKKKNALLLMDADFKELHRNDEEGLLSEIDAEYLKK